MAAMSSIRGSSAGNLLNPSRRCESFRPFQLVNVFSVPDCPIDLTKDFVGQAKNASSNREVTNDPPTELPTSKRHNINADDRSVIGRNEVLRIGNLTGTGAIAKCRGSRLMST